MIGGSDSTEASCTDIWCLSRGDGAIAWKRIPCVGEVPPAISSSAAVAFDHSIWMFGGIARLDNRSIKDSFRFNVSNNQWIRLSPRGDIPQARNSHSMVACNGNMYVFGGWDDGRFFDDMYALHSHGTAWSQVHQSATMRPSPRMGHSAVAYRNSMLVFGGFCHPVTLGDLWEFNFALSRWEQLPAHGQAPTDRYRHSAVVIMDLLIVFGGISANKQRFDDVFCYDINQKSWFKFLFDSDVPCPRSFHQAVAVGGAMYVFGGMGEDGARLNDTFRMTTPHFTRSTRPPPPPISRTSERMPEAIQQGHLQWCEITTSETLEPRTGHIAYVFEDRLFVLGGSTTAGLSSDIYSLDLTSGVWNIEQVCGTPPSPRSGSRTAIQGNSLWMFGGYTEKKGTYFDEIFHLSLDFMEWRILRPNPSSSTPCARVDHSMVIIGSTLVVFGGATRKEILGDTYAFSLESGTWTAVTVPDGPRGRMGHSAVTHEDSMYVYGGWDGESLVADMFSLSATTGLWTMVVADGTNPCRRYRHSAVVYGDDMFVFGGIGEQQQRMNDLYSFNFPNNSWTRIEYSGATVPTARTFHESAVTSDGRMLVVGGRSDAKLGDVWSISLRSRVPEPRVVEIDEEAEGELERLRKRVAHLESRVLCKVCMEREINCVLMPCTHRCICLSCASIIVNRECMCPICRETILRLLETIDA